MMNQVKYTMPAEWEAHERTIIEWPVKASLVWQDNYEAVCMGYGELVRAISAFEPVTVIINEEDEEDIRRLCGTTVDIIRIPHNDAWARDNGPTFVRDGEGKLHGISWRFNAWGEKYLPYDLDDKVASILLNQLDVPCIEVPLVLEGGSIHVDGEGTLLTTKECLLNPNRNPDLSQADIELIIKRYLNVSKIIWLDQGLYGDETDGHIDNIACFAKPGAVLLQACDDPKDPNYEITQKAREVLKHAKDAKSRNLEIIELPTPPPCYYNNERLTLSYLNFYMVNKGIILPVFGGDATLTDERAKSILEKVFSDRKVITVDGMALITEGGNVHCITQQMPLKAISDIKEGKP
ncbi:putative agmatine deiminase [Petrocella atlantisensis]|uniref:Putative agmatine deiminase n=1 Tax=Petrocella atlantisensis TaxID=2173034 RepID=A0A3P7P0T9_9FIRM|nr:agmatine deiminase family protein [Petrocella atlantisensis]VDN48805.1 putative agmatine deiminase [Petrocella atlantisensis]